MRNFFFFISRRETNAQGQRRMMLFPLPGQQTLVTTMTRGEVDTTRRAQCSNSDLRRVCRYPEGTIFGVETQGSTPWAARLKNYSRNGEQFYNVSENTLFAIGLEEQAYVAMDDQFRPGERMASAYAALVPQETPAAPTALQRFSVMYLAPIEEVDVWRQAGMVFNQIVNLSTLRDRMLQGIVKFVYRKADGSTRTAYGTRNAGFLNNVPYSSERARQNSANRTFSYFDVQRRDFRCFSLGNLVSVSLDIFEPTVSNMDIIAAIPLQTS